jgi:hypothetical protein
MSKVVCLTLAEIVRSKDLQTRPLDAGTVHRYAQAYKAKTELPPIVVVQIAKGPPMLLDGWHRVTALEQIGSHDVEAEVVEAMNIDGARWLAMKANLTHGLPIKPKQRREVFRAFMRADQWRKGARGAKSLREIGAELGASHNTIRTWMQKDFRRISRDHYSGMSDEAGTWRSGGLRQASRSRTMRDVALESVNAALQAFGGVAKPEERGEVIAKLEGVLKAMRDAGDWKPWKTDTDF